jgi:hypothetical protein
VLQAADEAVRAGAVSNDSPADSLQLAIRTPPTTPVVQL